ncbi:hypothetical protein IF2G_03524 [Cordyceps javanica]|nr:hypothetical protein IF2G_03524 [Cordyceps javanica]
MRSIRNICTCATATLFQFCLGGRGEAKIILVGHLSTCPNLTPRAMPFRCMGAKTVHRCMSVPTAQRASLLLCKVSARVYMFYPLICYP